MINVSNKFKQALLDDKRQFQIEATITLIDDTELTITNSELWSQGFEIDTSVSGNNSFDIGGLIIGRMTLVINNIYEDYTQYDFFDADVDVTLTLPFDDGTSESIVFDNFIVDEATDNESQIVLTCLDNAKHFERPYSESNLVYPASVDTIVRDACDTCGVPLLTTSIRNGNYVVPARPSSDGLTFLKVVSWCAQLTGNFARINNHGQLVVGWYDRNTYDSVNKVNGTEWTITGNTAKKFHHIVSWSSLTVGTDDVTVTGLRVVATSSDNTEFVGFYGSEGYVLEVRGNDLIGVSDVQNIANSIGANVVGLKLRTYNGACLGDPTIEASDLAWITDRKNRSYKTLICGTSFKLGQYQSLYCGASTPSKRASTSYSESTRAIVKTRQEIKKSLADYDSRVSSMAELIARGFGMYFTPVTQQDGSVIPYIHDKPTIEESSYIAYMTSQGIMMESDGESTAAVDRNGNALLNTLTARGINADWINSGAISIRDTQGNETFYANCLTGEVRINATSFSLTGSTVQQIAQEAVDNIEIGGRNLLLNSDEDTSVTTTASTNGGTVVTSYFNVSDYGKNFTSSTEQVFTVSAWYEFTGDAVGANTRIYAQFHGTAIAGANVVGYGEHSYDSITSTTQSGVYRRAFKLTEAQANPSGQKRLRIVLRYTPNGAIDTIKITKIKLELGNRATDWTLAPEDNSIDNISVGGRNLILDGNFTNDFAKWELQNQSDATLPEITTEDGIKCCHYQGAVGKYAQRRQNIFARIANDEVGQLYTLSFDMKMTNYTPGTTNPYVKAYFSGQYDNNGTAKFLGATFGKEDPDLTPYNNKGWAHVVVSNLYFEHKPINNEMWFMIYSRDWSGDLYFTNLKLERGNKATDFTLAPEDVQADIDTATATANAANATAQQANATAQQALDIASSAGGLVAYLDNDYQSVPTDADGNYVTFPECSSKITVFYNSNDVSTQCTYTTAVTNGVTGSWDNATRTYSVTGLTADSGTVTITAAYDNTSLSKKFTVIKVRQGISGTNGQNGRSISSMEEYYAISASNSTAPTSWSENVVAPTENEPYLWNYNRIVYDDNTQEDSQPRVIGNYARNGTDGQPGQNGQNGRGITSITEHYGLSNSTTTEPTSWSDAMQVPTSSAKYLWNYETIAYTDGTSENTSKRIIGNFGADGKSAYNYELILSDVAIVKDGDGNITPSTITMTAKRGQGTSTPGNYAGRFKVEVTTNGTSYTTAYTSSANEATHTYTPTGNEKNIRISLYLAGGTSTLLDSQNIPIVSDGADGFSPTVVSNKADGVTTVTITDASGTHNLTINDGAAGSSIKSIENFYLASANATGVTVNTVGWTNDPSSADATISASKPYLWNYEVSKDDKGATITTTSPVVIGYYGQTGATGKGIKSISEYYALSNTTSTPDDSSFSLTVKTPSVSSRYLWNYEKITYTDDSVTTTSKHIIGVYGDPATTVVLTNESHTFPGDVSNALASSFDCSVFAYSGTTRVPAKIGNITGLPSKGLSVTITNNETTTAKITVTSTTELTLQSGTLNIPITVEGKTFTKKLAWSVAYRGRTGEGTPARSYFLDLSSKSVKYGENLRYFPSVLTAKAYYRDGASTSQMAYTGYIAVQVCIGTSWSTIKTYNASTVSLSLASNSTATKATISDNDVLTLPLNSTAIRFQLKATSSSSIYLDQQDTTILIDIESLTQEAIFNKLTNNSKDQGVYLENGKVYINAEYIQSWILKLGGANNKNGLLDVYDASGNLVGYWTKDGIKLGGTLTDVHASTDAPYTSIDVDGHLKTKHFEASDSIKINGVSKGSSITTTGYDGYFIFPFGWDWFKDSDNYGMFKLTEDGLDIDTGYNTHILAGRTKGFSFEDNENEKTSSLTNEALKMKDTSMVTNPDKEKGAELYLDKNSLEMTSSGGVMSRKRVDVCPDYISIGTSVGGPSGSSAYMTPTGSVGARRFSLLNTYYSSNYDGYVASFEYVKDDGTDEPSRNNIVPKTFDTFFKTRHVSDTITVPANSYADGTVYLYDSSWTGWKPIAVSGFMASGSSYLSVLQVYLSGDTALKYRLGCRGTSSDVSATLRVDVLYIRN